MPELLSVSIDWNGVDRAVEAVAAFGDDLKPVGDVLFDEWLSPEEKAWFESEGEGTWAVSPAYAARKADLYGNLPIEQLPDRTLMKSLTEKGAAGLVWDVSASGITYGSSVTYAAAQDAKNELIFPLTEERMSGMDAIVLREWVTFTRAQGLEVI